MSKLSMDKDTILFIDSKNNKALGMNYEYYSLHYNEISSDHKITDPDYILYKFGETYDSWVNFQKAISTKKGIMCERLVEAFKDLTYRITDLKIIPKTIYYDKDGYIWEISPYDGCSDSTYWIPRSDNMDLRQNFDFSLDTTGKHGRITFNKPIDIDNALVSVNGIFYDFKIVERGETPTIIVPDLVTKLPIIQTNMSKLSDSEVEEELNRLAKEVSEKQIQLTGLINKNTEYEEAIPKLVRKLEEDPTNEDIRLQISNYYSKIAVNNSHIKNYNADIQDLINEYNDIKAKLHYRYKVDVKVYTWENIKKDILTPPKKVVDEWFETVSNVDENCIIIYNGVIMDFIVNPINSNQFKFVDVPLSSMKMMSFGKIRIHKFSHTDPNRGIRKCVIRGHNNVHRNTVDFVLPVHQSLIVYEGVDHQYDVVESATIVYSTDVNYVDDSARVYSINFTPAG